LRSPSKVCRFRKHKRVLTRSWYAGRSAGWARRGPFCIEARWNITTTGTSAPSNHGAGSSVQGPVSAPSFAFAATIVVRRLPPILSRLASPGRSRPAGPTPQAPSARGAFSFGVRNLFQVVSPEDERRHRRPSVTLADRKRCKRRESPKVNGMPASHGSVGYGRGASRGGAESPGHTGPSGDLRSVGWNTSGSPRDLC